MATVDHLEGREEAMVLPAAVEIMFGATTAAQRELLLPRLGRPLLNMWWLRGLLKLALLCLSIAK
jgi:hypothetical protein